MSLPPEYAIMVGMSVTVNSEKQGFCSEGVFELEPC